MAGPGVAVEAVEQMPALDTVRVRDCMHHGFLRCDPEAALPEVAALMAASRVHALLVYDDDAREARVVSDRDVIAGVARGDKSSAKDIAGTEALSTSGDSSLREAAQLMTDGAVSHLIVRDHTSGQPIGVISTTDILRACADPVTGPEPADV
jgi:predicted transcriptional regulator